MRILLAAVYPYSFLLLYLIIPFDNYIRALPNILMAILIVAFPFIVKKEDFKKLKSFPIAVFLILLLYLGINSFLAGRLSEDFNIIKKMMIVLGLVILYIPVADVKKINTAIIFSALAAIVFSVYNFVLITDSSASFAFGESPQVIESLLIDRLYLGLLSTFSILISFQELHKKYHPNNNYYLANILVNVVFIILIASKVALISLFILLLIRLFYGKRKIWKVFILVISMVAIVGLFLFLKNQKGDQLYNEEVADQYLPPSFIANSMTYELRTIVWKCAANIIDDQGFTVTGIGFGETKERLVACYQNEIVNPEKKREFLSSRYNTHNQFLDFYLSAGFIALLLFLVFIAISFFRIKRNFLPTAMLVVLVIYCLIENVFHRQIGAYYIGFILIVLISSTNAVENNEIKNI